VSASAAGPAGVGLRGAGLRGAGLRSAGPQGAGAAPRGHRGEAGAPRARAIVVGAKIAGSAILWATGFRAVSDDDFARVVIAQGFARAPSLDPSGTSWLPLPFWVTGGVMALLGRELWVARAVALVLGVVAALVVHQAARWLLRDERPALIGALLAALVPWSLRLGVATVPELPVAAAIVLAAASTAPGWTPRRRLWGGAALAAACLARYEPWLVALPFAVITLIDARLVRARNRVRLGVAAALPLAAMGGWIAWNAHRHGDALAFLERVASYRRALGGEGVGGEGGGPARAVGEYLLALVVAEPELICATGVLVVVAVVTGVGRDVAVASRRAALLLGCQIAMLVVAGVKDGAPTHHPERALLAPLLFVAVIAGALLVELQRAGGTRTRRGAIAALVVVALLGGRSIRKRHPPAMAPRGDEVAVADRVAAVVPAGERVLIEVVDYGYFAVQAGSGRPEDLVPDRDLDPRKEKVASAFRGQSALEARAREVGARWVVGRAPIAGSACEGMAPPGALCVARAPGGRGATGEE
jgi:hypothetical protein